MQNNLVIVESPAKAKTIEKFLGEGYKVLSSYGHIRDLKQKAFSIDIKSHFKPIYEIPEDKKKLVAELKEEAAKADRALVMSKGKVVLEGTPKEVFSQTEKVRSLHLDVPQAAELRDELAAAGLPMPENIITPEECAKAIFDLLK